MDYARKATLLLLSFIFLPFAYAQDEVPFSEWDKDDDGLIEKYEFINTFMDEYENDWNVIDDSHLDDEDFYHVTHAMADTDGDGFIEEEEWALSYDYLYSDYLIYEDVAVYDVDGDNMISYNEYYDAMYDTDYYSDWDVDNDTYLSEFELAEAVFEAWDVNDSGTIGTSEFNSFDAFYLDV